MYFLYRNISKCVTGRNTEDSTLVCFLSLVGRKFENVFFHKPYLYSRTYWYCTDLLHSTAYLQSE